jgi:hypothetical protein
MTIEHTLDLQARSLASRWAWTRSVPRTWILWLAAAGLAVLLAVPFFLVDLPPVLDYPNHLARFAILAHPDDPYLARIYAPHWALLPNLGADVIGMVLLKLTPVHVGGRLVLALSLYAPILGVITYNRVAFGRLSWWALGSALAAYNGVFFMGFMNFLISLGVAFAGAAAWLAMRRRGAVWSAAAVGAAAMTGVFFCHIFGVAVMGLLIGSHEAERLMGLWTSTRRPPLTEAAKAGGLLGLTILPVAALYAACPVSKTASDPRMWGDVAHKAWQLLSAFMSYSAPLTLITGAVFLAIVILGWRGARFAPGARLALAAAAAAYAVEPGFFKGGAFIDLRAGLVLGLLVFAMVQPRIERRYALACGLAAAALIGVRVAYVASAWIDHRGDLADVRSAIAPVAPGARVLVARGHSSDWKGAAPAERLLPGVHETDSHIPALLLIERRAFWPLIFADPGRQSITLRAPYDALRDPQAEPARWSVLAQDRSNAEDLKMAPFLVGWRRNFDYVLLIDAEGAGPVPDGLTLVHAGAYARLYRTARQAGDEASQG